ncbi:IucA/IucC family C-terminal-domain containing protein [Tuberibacillus sp. Marseille-P3662]|uniref:IucA/IucC family C-terminal-domain containing protein n=1 Tax=Tuberibacillus sp. Marseille-P3662 TaxID=1965358 RepID=UPI00159307C0|nr:IucA/IucC family C-terminal-domain containing protein [Tuberibacillus sp. Marseille-P3662]
MLSYLNAGEEQFLQAHLRYTNHYQDMNATPVRSLFTEETMTNFLREASQKLQSPSLLVTASQFCKRYAFLITAPALYALSAFHKRLDVDVDNCRIVDHSNNGLWMPQLTLNNRHVTPQPASSDREHWRRTAFTKLFKHNLSRIIRLLSDISRVPEPILWENSATYIFWLYETKLPENGVRSLEMREDFQSLLDADGDVFGCDFNPIRPFYTPKRDGVRMRKTCCQYYQIPGADYCSTCRNGCIDVRHHTRAKVNVT